MYNLNNICACTKNIVIISMYTTTSLLACTKIVRSSYFNTECKHEQMKDTITYHQNIVAKLKHKVGLINERANTKNVDTPTLSSSPCRRSLKYILIDKGILVQIFSQ